MVRLLAGIFVVGFVYLPFTANAQTLAKIRAAQHMDCGTVQTEDDWNYQDIHGDLSALGGEICRAVATAILGADKVTIHTFPAEPEALAGLKTGETELAVGISPSTTVAMQYRVAFGPPVFYDTERFLVAKSAELKDINGLRDQTVCAMNLSQPQRVLQDEMTARGIPYGLQGHSEVGEMTASVMVRRCLAGAAMESWLADARAGFPAKAEEFVFLPERIGLEPVVPAYLYGDQAFDLVVKWTISALIEAEALGITQANVEEAMKREDMRAERLLGKDFAVAQALGLDHDWAAKVIGTTGNYGEIFQRTTGKPLRIDRGLNALWTQGGLMRPVPMQ